MTARVGPDRANPEEVVPLWSYWTSWGLGQEGVTMHGWWDDEPVITTGDEQVKATSFLKEADSAGSVRMLVALGNFGNVTRSVRLTAGGELSALVSLRTARTHTSGVPW